MFNFNGIREEDLVLFQEHISNKVLMQRAQAIVAQRKAHQVAQKLGGQRIARDGKGVLVSAPVANIAPEYYYARMGEEREASSARLDHNENVWEDPDFLPFELKRNPALRPITQDPDKRPTVHFGGIDEVSAAPSAAVHAQAPYDKDAKYLV